MIDLKTVEKYTKGYTHRFYDESVKIKNELAVHSNGECGSHLVEAARPNEQDIYKKYRKEIEEPVSKTYFEKVMNVFGKIRLAPDWGVVWPTKTSIVKKPQDFFEEQFPDFGSLQEWFFFGWHGLNGR